MKEALFGKGKGEQVNKNLLKDYLNEQVKMENEYRKLKGEEPMPMPQGVDKGSNWYNKIYEDGRSGEGNVVDYGDL